MLHPGTHLLEIIAKLPNLEEHQLITSYCKLLFEDFYFLTPHELLERIEYNFSLNKKISYEVRKLLAYLPKLLFVENNLVRWYELLANAWQNSHNEALCGEKLLEVIIALLPDNLDNLQYLLNFKITPASQFASKGQFSAILISLSAALEYKVKQLSENQPLELDIPAGKINSVIPAYDLLVQESILLDTCHKYLTYLQGHIAPQLKSNQDACNMYADKGIFWTKEAILALSNDEVEYRQLSSEKEYICGKNKNLRLLFKKFQIIHLLITKLSHSETAIFDRLEDFHIHYLHGEPILRETGSYLYNRVYEGSASVLGQAGTYRGHTWRINEGIYVEKLTEINTRLQNEYFSRAYHRPKF